MSICDDSLLHVRLYDNWLQQIVFALSVKQLTLSYKISQDILSEPDELSTVEIFSLSYEVRDLTWHSCFIMYLNSELKTSATDDFLFNLYAEAFFLVLSA